MADLPPHPDTNSGIGVVPDRKPTIPLWVKVFGIIAIVLVLLFVILHLTGNSPFSPGDHTPPVEHGGQQP